MKKLTIILISVLLVSVFGIGIAIASSFTLTPTATYENSTIETWDMSKRISNTGLIGDELYSINGKVFVNLNSGGLGIGTYPRVALDVVGDVNVSGNMVVNGVNLLEENEALKKALCEIKPELELCKS